MRTPWTEIAAEKRANQDAHIDEHCSRNKEVCSDSNTLADIQTLTNSIKRGKLSAEDVIKAYIDKACAAHEKTNCLTEICFDKAIAHAKELDEFQRKEGRLIGPLHGVPISLKDQFNLKGLDTTLGYVGRAFKPATCNALLVDILEHLGAVIIAKTNLPQSIMWCETENPLWGLTTHPENPKLTPGGSSGGEAALLALHGSMVGWGTDIGGSIRIPSHMNGLWGLKPSAGRMPYKGVEVSLDGQQHVPSAVGPMARTLESLTLVTKLVIEAESWTMDAQLPPLPWRHETFNDFTRRPLVIAVMLNDGMVKVHPPIERVLKELISKLQEVGHEIVDWDTSMNAECIAIMQDAYYTADGGKDIHQAVTEGGEPFLPHVKALVDRAPPISVYEYWQLNKRKVAAQQAYQDMWSRARAPSGRVVDLLLTPTMPHTAVPHRSCRWVGYTKLFNFLDYTALSFPAGKVSSELDPVALPEYTPRNSLDAWNWETYDLAMMDGHDIGLQIVGRRYEEEKVLGAAKQIDDLLRAET
ncbi:hypothetical protein E8E13_001705 [Curvularia kusanoi]|uniref:amidase n=1 Tax=Curvularia kusanoi TaxID=90978 RepID=A0A9P4W779_CURKU|nr:hypothetical protein E8E13_001705 [Curvularia kusanoi]